MKKLLLAMALAQLCGLQLAAQESSVKILLNEEERFRFEGQRLEFVNPDSSIFIGDSTGATGSLAHKSVMIGFFAGNNDTAGLQNVYIGAFSGYHEFHGANNTYIGYNSGKESDSAYSNTFVGSLSGEYNTTGNINTFIGRRAGNLNTTGSENTFLGQGAGHQNDAGNCNTFIGRFAGGYNNGGDSNVFLGYTAGLRNTNSNSLIIANNDTGDPLVYGSFNNKMLRFNANRMEIRNPLENTIIGDSSGTQVSGNQNVLVGAQAGKYLRNGSSNTYIGYHAGLSDTSGRGNVFIGYYAGASELGSNKLYIDNGGTPEPLIYGNFEKHKLKFHADTVQALGKFYAAGEIRTDQQYNINGNPGVTDTINSVTSFDFAEQKLKYRTTIFNGGIATYVSPESGWVDEVGEYFTPCGMISIIGEFSEWAGDQNMTRDPYNPDLWSTTVQFTSEDDCHPAPCDSIIKVKFREDASWDVNWGSAEFPSGTGIQGGDSIPVPLDKVYEPTIFYVTFNCKTGEYAFTDLSGYCPDSITDIRDNKKYATVLIGSQCWMAQDLNVGTQIDSTSVPIDNDIIEKYCYRDLESNCTQWGGLYQWNELMDYATTPAVQGICPAGFHVPTDADFKILEGNVDSQFGPGSVEWNKPDWRGYDAGLNLRSVDWAGGTDAFGFHSLPGGYLTDWGDGPGYYDSGCCNCYPTSTAGSLDNTYNIRCMNGNTRNQINRADNTMINDGLSLRCLKD